MKLTAAAIAVAFIAAASPLRATTLLSFSAQQDSAGVVVSWKTAPDAQNLGFNVYRATSDGARAKVNPHLIAGAALEHAGSSRNFRWRDAFAGGGFVQYYVEDVDVHGARTMHGPITPLLATGTITGGNTDTIADLGSAGGIFESPDGLGAPVSAAATPTKQQISQQYDLASQPDAKLFVTTEGWTRVTKSALVAAGFDPGSDPKSLSLFVDGAEIPIVVDDGGDGRFDSSDTIAFYGTGIDTASTGAHAYWLVSNKGRRMRIDTGRAASSTAAAPPNFAYTYSRVERTLFFAGLTNNGDRENFFGAVVSSWPVSEDVSARGLDTAAAGTAALDLALQGGTDGPHIVSIQWNGAQIATATFDGQQRYATTVQVPIASIAAGTNTLTFTALGGDWDFSMVESLRLTYPHRYTADRDALKCTAAGGTALSIDGFTQTGVKVVDVTDPLNPSFVAATVRASGGAYAASFVVPGSGARTILAFAAGRILAPAQIAPSTPSSWHDAKNGAQMVIIANRALIDSAAPLKNARDAHGISTVIVDVQDLYDEFGFGHRGPKPIRDFLAATRSWRTPPRYAILLGDASFDPRNYLGLGAFDLVPTKLIPTQFLKTASDDWFADFNDNGSPALALGRLPARTAADASIMVGKIVNRGTLANNVQLISDGWDDDFSFNAAADALVPLIPSTLTSSHFDLTEVADPHGDAVAAMNRGALLVNYVGHGVVDSWGPAVYTNDDAAAMTTSSRPFVVAMDCLTGYFQDLYTTSFAEMLMLNPNGAVAVWTSSTLTFPQPQALMNQELFRQLFGGAPAIGDAIVRAKAATTDLDVKRTWILFGDPSMPLR